MPTSLVVNSVSREGFSIEIWDYGNKMPMRVSDSFCEAWLIDISMRSAHTPTVLAQKESLSEYSESERREKLATQALHEQLLEEYGKKYNALSLTKTSGVSDEKHQIAPELAQQNSDFRRRAAIRLAQQFQINGFQKTLNVTIGQLDDVKRSLNLQINAENDVVQVPVTLTLHRVSSVRRKKEITAIEHEYEAPPPPPRSSPLPKLQYGLGGSETSKLKQLASTVINQLGLKVLTPNALTYISMLETKYMRTERTEAYRRAVNDLTMWFNEHTTIP